MAKNFRHEAEMQSCSPASLANRMRERQQQKIVQLKLALIEDGFQTVREQADALGLSHSSAWAILQAKHKHRGLTSRVIERMRSSPRLPAKARQLIEDYVRERLSGVYGHSRQSLRAFAKLNNMEGSSPKKLPQRRM